MQIKNKFKVTKLTTSALLLSASIFSISPALSNEDDSYFFRTPGYTADLMSINSTEDVNPAVSIENNNYVFSVGVPIAPIVPTVTEEISGNVWTNAGLTFSLAGELPPGLSIDLNTGVISGTPSSDFFADGLVVTALDAEGDSGSTSLFTITINPAIVETPDVYMSFVSRVFDVGVSIPVVTPIVNNQSDGQPWSGGSLAFNLTGTLPDGLSFDASTGSISGVPTSMGYFDGLIIEVDDGLGNSSSTSEFTIGTYESASVPFLFQNQSFPLRVVNIGDPLSPEYTHLVRENDFFGDLWDFPGLEYHVSTVPWAAPSDSIGTELMPGLLFDTTTGTISGTPTETGYIPYIDVAVVDDEGQFSSITNKYAILVQDPSLIPSISLSDVNFVAGDLLSVSPDVSELVSGDAWTDPNLTFSISPSAPSGLSFDTATGVISGTINNSHYSSGYVITVTDLEGSQDATDEFSIASYDPNEVPVVGGVSSGLIQVNRSSPLPVITPVVTESITGNAWLHSGLVYTVNKALPSGITIDSATGVISGTPVEGDIVTGIVIRATDAEGEFGESVAFDIEVFASEIQPEITVNAPNGFFDYSEYFDSFEILMNVADILSGNPINGGLTYSINQTLPFGFDFDTTTGVITNSGIFETTYVTGAVVTVTASNGNSDSSAPFDFGFHDAGMSQPQFGSLYNSSYTFGPGQLITPITPAPISFSTGSPWGFDLTYSLGGDALPSGLSIDSTTGVISGSTSQLGTYNIDLIATDPYFVPGNGFSATTTVPITIEISAPTPVFGTEPSSVSVLPSGSNYSFIPVVNSSTGGLWSAGGLTFTINKTLPAGLSFNTSTGEISGTPSASGVFTGFKITVTDGNGSLSETGTFNFIVS